MEDSIVKAGRCPAAHPIPGHEGALGAVRDGAIRLPEGPGLGVMLDQVALKKYMRRREELTV